MMKIVSCFWWRFTLNRPFLMSLSAFTGQTLANHSYVDLSTVGSASDNSDSVVCHTHLSTCCSGSQGIHRGDWCFPNGTVLPFAGRSVPIGLARNANIAVIRRTTATGPTGIYSCRIATRVVHDDTDISVGETVYVGLYVSGGMSVKMYFCGSGKCVICALQSKGFIQKWL